MGESKGRCEVRVFFPLGPSLQGVFRSDVFLSQKSLNLMVTSSTRLLPVSTDLSLSLLLWPQGWWHLLVLALGHCLILQVPSAPCWDTDRMSRWLGLSGLWVQCAQFPFVEHCFPAFPLPFLPLCFLRWLVAAWVQGAGAVLRTFLHHSCVASLVPWIPHLPLLVYSFIAPEAYQFF